MTPFVTNRQFLQRYDGRWVGQNILDDNSAASIASLQIVSTEAGTRLQSILSEASEMVMSAAAVGARYTERDLRDRPNDSPPYVGGGDFLVRIVCNIAMGLVLMRRGRALSDENALSGPYNDAMAQLELLRRGERIFFNVPGVPEAGLPSTASMAPRPGIDPPLITQEAARYFGTGPFPNYPGYYGGNWWGGW